MYSFSLFILYGYITKSHSDQLVDVLIAQSVRHCTDIAEVMGSNPVPAWILFRLFHIFICRKINIGPIYTGDGLSIWDEFGQKTVAHLIIRLCINTGEANIYPHVSYRDSPSSDTNHRGYLFKKDDPSVCLYFYADGLSDELPFFAQARPKRMIRLQYKSGYQL